MSEPRPFEAALARYREASAPREVERERLRRRLHDEVFARGAVAGPRAAPRPAPGAGERVRARVRADRAIASRPWVVGAWSSGPRSPWRGPAVAAALAVGLLAALLLRPEPSEPTGEVVAEVEVEVEPVAAPPLLAPLEPLGTVGPLRGADPSPPPAPARPRRAEPDPSAEPPGGEPDALARVAPPAPAPPPRSPVPEPPPVALDSELLQKSRPHPAVLLAYTGAGSLARRGDELELRWNRGTLDVEVEPERGVTLSVHGRHASAVVLGTGFRVVTTPEGTDVSVRHGKVLVICAAGGTARVEAGRSRFCPAVDAMTLYERVESLRDAEADCSLLLPAATSALDAWDDTLDPRPWGELMITKIRCLDEGGRLAELRGAAEAYRLSGERTHADEVAALLGRWQR